MARSKSTLGTYFVRDLQVQVSLPNRHEDQINHDKYTDIAGSGIALLTAWRELPCDVEKKERRWYMWIPPSESIIARSFNSFAVVCLHYAFMVSRSEDAE